MALQKTLTIDHVGLTLDAAYLKVDAIHIESKMVFFSVLAYASAAARHENRQPLNSYPFSLIPVGEVEALEGADFIAKLYEFVKAYGDGLADDAVDV